MQWFKIPEKIYFESGCLQYLEKMPDISRAFIVTDPQMVKLGYVDRVLYYLRKRKKLCPLRDIYRRGARPVAGYGAKRREDDGQL